MLWGDSMRPSLEYEELNRTLLADFPSLIKEFPEKVGPDPDPGPYVVFGSVFNYHVERSFRDPPRSTAHSGIHRAHGGGRRWENGGPSEDRDSSNASHLARYSQSLLAIFGHAYAPYAGRIGLVNSPKHRDTTMTRYSGYRYDYDLRDPGMTTRAYPVLL